MGAAVNVLPNSPKTSNMRKRDVFYLNLSWFNGKLGCNCCRADLSSDIDSWTCWLSKGVLKRKRSGLEAISKEFLNDRIEMLLQNNKIINRLNRNKNSYHLNESLLDSSITDLLPSTRKSSSNSDTPQITRTPSQTSIIDFSHIPKVNIENIPGELTLAQFRNLILTELGNDIKIIVRNEIRTPQKWNTKVGSIIY